MIPHDSASAVKRAAHFLTKVQQDDGSFLSGSSPAAKPFKQKFAYSTVFTQATILGALAGVDDEDVAPVRTRLAAWLLSQKSQNWSFNYWANGTPERSNLPYPDDLDDTFCALAGLYAHDPSLLNGEALGRIVKLLIAAEIKPGGPYRTWLVPKSVEKSSNERWLDVDLAVNCNVANFLSMVSNPLHNLTRLMDRAIATQKFTSPYYPSEYPVLYYLARAYRGTGKTRLAKHISVLRQTDGSWESPLQTALMVSALVNLGHAKNLESTEAFLLNAQRSDGSWAAEAFCLDPARDQTQYFSGAQSLTTALVVEALHKLSSASASTAARPKFTASVRAKQIHSRVVTAAQAQIDQLGEDSSQAAMPVLEQLVRDDSGHNVILLPHLFYESLRDRAVLDNQIFIDLGLANLYGWIAYTIYDDFIDDEGDPKLLGAANACLRYSLRQFEQALPRNATFQKLVDKCFDAIDSANAWEANHCRLTIVDDVLHLDRLPDFGDLGQLADRSLGHTLTPLGVLVAMGESPDGPAVASCFKALRHYLIARQLNDDLHDWEADIRKGRVTYVVGEILNELKLHATQQDLRRLLPVMRQQFWHLTLPQVVSTVTEHVHVARQALTDHPLLKTKNAITVLLDDIESINAKTLSTVADAEAFLSSYRLSK